MPAQVRSLISITPAALALGFIDIVAPARKLSFFVAPAADLSTAVYEGKLLLLLLLLLPLIEETTMELENIGILIFRNNRPPGSLIPSIFQRYSW